MRVNVKNWFRPKAPRPQSAMLYSRCVAGARHTFFYTTLGVPDSVDGRFDLLVLHLFLLLSRLKKNPQMASDITDIFFADMDQNLRQMGVADPGVGKRIRVMLDAFYGRIAAYESARGDEAALSAALIRNLYGTAPVPEFAPAALLDYVRRAEAGLAALSPEAFQAGHCVWPQHHTTLT